MEQTTLRTCLTKIGSSLHALQAVPEALKPVGSRKFMLAVEAIVQGTGNVQKGNVFFQTDSKLSKALMDNALARWIADMGTSGKRISSENVMIISVTELEE